MNIIIPLCGKGERFKSKYNIIKPLIHVFEKQIILYILDNLFYSSIDKDIYIIINKNTNQTNIIDIILNKYPTIKFIDIEKETEGALETILLGIKKIVNFKYKNLLIVDGDNFYTTNVIDNINLNKNTILYFEDKGNDALYSYIKINNYIVEDIIEKKKNK